MPQFLLDTDHLTLLEHSHPPLVTRMAALPPAGLPKVSAVSVEEAFRGRLARLSRPLVGAARVQAYAHLVGTLELLKRLETAPFDQGAELQFQHLRALPVRIGTPDLKIAAVALAHQMVLLTRNRRDFSQVPGLGRLVSVTCMKGDDIIDLPVMRRVGFAIATANARPQVKAAAHYTTPMSGGFGAGRDAIDFILNARGILDEMIEQYLDAENPESQRADIGVGNM